MSRPQIAAAFSIVFTLALAGAVYAKGNPAPSPSPASGDVIAELGLAAAAADTASFPAACACDCEGKDAPHAVVMKVRQTSETAMKEKYDALMEELRASGDITDAGLEKMKAAFEGLLEASQPKHGMAVFHELHGADGDPSPATRAYVFKGSDLDPEQAAKIEAEVAEALKAAGIGDGEIEKRIELRLNGLKELKELEGLKGLHGQEIRIQLEALKELEGLDELGENKFLRVHPMGAAPGGFELAELEEKLGKLLEETLPRLEERLKALEEKLAQERTDSGE